jgi:hypothetical protein
MGEIDRAVLDGRDEGLSESISRTARTRFSAQPSWPNTPAETISEISLAMSAGGTWRDRQRDSSVSDPGRSN